MILLYFIFVWMIMHIIKVNLYNYILITYDVFVCKYTIIPSITIKSVQAIGQKLYLKYEYIYTCMKLLKYYQNSPSLFVVMYMLRCISSYFWFTEKLWIPTVTNSKLDTTYHSLKIWGHSLQNVIWLLQQVYF